MTLPTFYIPVYDPALPEILLEEDPSRHIVQVLRMRIGSLLQLTDGKGHLLTAGIVDDHKKKCLVKVENTVHLPPPAKKVSIAISLLKNAARFEWFLEKATEIGVSEIIPLLCERTEKQHFRQDRMQQILISAMLQSQQAWMPELRSPLPYAGILNGEDYPNKFIAHCVEEEKKALPDATGPCRILIGPEGDFSPKEIGGALREGFVPVTLGGTRLRSETAGVVAATLLCLRA